MRSKFSKVVIATSNPHKFEEIKDILSRVLDSVSFFSLSDFGKFREPEETGKTFFENALIKANYYYSLLKVPVITEDSGLEVEALGGEPGVLSARYAGPDSSQKKLIEKLLRNMNGKTNRRARFVCLAMFMYESGKYIFSEGKVTGTIAYEARGEHGFGYDPIFIPDGYSKTFAELGPEIKNRISHRKHAFFNLAIRIKELLEQ